MNLETPFVSIAKSPAELQAIFADPPLLQSMMPEGVERFIAHANGFEFGLKGLPPVTLEKSEDRPDATVWNSVAGPLKFTLTCAMTPEGTGTRAQVLFQGEVNAMLRMMIERPLQNFLNQLAEKLKDL
jgi:carbon monoxide dehydrogenase subunit G